MAWKSIGQAMQDVADHRPRGRGDDADHRGQIGQSPFAVGVEQAFGGQTLLAVFDEFQERALALPAPCARPRFGISNARDRW
jgi:hypothetical protein